MARKLVLEHAQAQIQAALGESTDPARVAPGKMRLYSYYKPALEADTYLINPTQVITVPAYSESNGKAHDEQTKTLKNTIDGTLNGSLAPQEFEVVAPQFSLDISQIHSTYPPDGHQDEGRVLPHIVFDDPHLPWERFAGKTFEGPLDIDLTDDGKQIFVDDEGVGHPVDVDSAGNKTFVDSNGVKQAVPGSWEPRTRSAVPWMALVVFDPDELTLATDEMNTGLFPTFDPNNPGKQPPTGAFPMTVGDYVRIGSSYIDPKTGVAPPPLDPKPPRDLSKLSRICYEADSSWDTIANKNEFFNSTEKTQVIFPKRQNFLDLFANVEQNKYCAHVRNIRTTGMPDAGIEDDGLFSIIVSHRTGRWDIPNPRPQVVHLVSIEHVDTTLRFTGTGDGRIAMISLYSWIYTCLPPNPISFVDDMRALGESQQFLKPSSSAVLGPLGAVATSKDPTASKAASKLIQRLDNGFTITRWRTQAGDETVAFNRGPLVPSPVPYGPLGAIPTNSTFSSDLQILDTDLGVMDVSYSAAWQLGKTLAIADRNFSAALMRFRALTYTKAASQTRTDAAGVSGVQDTLAKLPKIIDTMSSMSSGSTAPPQKIPAVPVQPDPALPMQHPDIQAAFHANVQSVVRQLSSSTDGTLYNEFNLPNNSDWPIIFGWISDKLFLSDIPSQYVFTDPSHLPMESLRFFHIDDTWLDSLIDGALSTANHLSQGDDRTRTTIKQCYNEYLAGPLIDGVIQDKPQIPSFGFAIRSAVVKAFPDLQIKILYDDTTDTRTDICRLTKLDENTILCLLDRKPEEIKSITVSQPPHHQRFSLGDELTKDQVEFAFLKLYMKNAPTEWTHQVPNVIYPRGQDGKSAIYNWNTRCVDMVALAGDITYEVNRADSASRIPPSTPGTTVIKPKPFDNPHYYDPITTSVAMALELNDPCWYFEMDQSIQATVPKRARQLWIDPNALKDPTPVDTPPTPPTQPLPPPQFQPPAPFPPSTLIPPSAPTKVVPAINPKPQTPGHLSGPTQAQYNYAIYPSYHRAPKPPPSTSSIPPYDPTNYIPTENEYLLDLIVSVRLRGPPDPINKLRLQKLVIEIPMDTGIAPAGGKKPPEPLLNLYDGPGARMLSNLRFLVYLVRGDNTLNCTIVPRSGNSVSLADARAGELSFRLNVCNIAPIKTIVHEPISATQTVEVGKCVVSCVELYEGFTQPNVPQITAFKQKKNDFP